MGMPTLKIPSGPDSNQSHTPAMNTDAPPGPSRSVVGNPRMQEAGGSLWSMAYASIAAGLAVACLIWHAVLEPQPRGGSLELLEYAFILLSTTALYRFYQCFSERLRLCEILNLPGLVVVFAAVLFFSICKLGMYQLGGFDESFLVNTAYHYLKGFRPIVDWLSPMPPLFMAGLTLIARFLPFRLASFSLFNAIFATLTCFWIFGLLRISRFPRHWALAITVAVELSTAFVEPFWWYNNSTSLTVVLLFLSVLACQREMHRLLPWLSLCISLGMAICAKPNAALMGLSPCVLLLTWQRSQWVKTAAVYVAAIGIALSICSFARISPVGLLHSYAEAAKLRGSPLRFLPFRQPSVHFVDAFVSVGLSVLLLMSFLDLFVRKVRDARQSWPLILTCLLATITSIEMLCTNMSLKMLDLIVMFVSITVLAEESQGKIPPQFKSLVIRIALLFTVWAGYFGVIHLRILEVGEGYFYEPVPTYKISDGFLAGLDAAPRLLRVQSEVMDALSHHPARKVFFGPLLEFEYPVFQRNVIPTLPVQWDPGNQYSSERNPALLENFKRADPDLLIILKHDYVGLENVADFVQHAPIYEVDDHYRELTLYIRKQPVEPVKNIGELFAQ